MVAEVRGDRLLVATGRRPRVDGIGLETVGIAADARGIPVDPRMQAGERLWAIGDVTGIWQLTHVGEYQGEIVASNILGERREANYEAVPRVTYTDPQAAAVGATDARFSATARLSELAKTATYTHAYAESNGFLTLLSDGERLTGAYALGPEAGEWMQQATLAIRRPRPARRPTRHDPAVPQLFRDPRRSGQGAPQADRIRPSRARPSGGPGLTHDMEMTGEHDMTTAPTASPALREPELVGQTVVIIGGSAGIGLETARRARAEGAEVILTARNRARLAEAARDAGALSTAAFDAHDVASLEQFFDSLPDPIDHVLVTAGGPHYGPLLEMAADEVRDAVTDHLMLELQVARHARGKMRAGGTLLFMSGTGGGRIRPGLGILAAATAALPPFTAALALELAPVRVNLIAAGFVDTPLSASLLGDGLEARREELRATLPIGRVVGPADVAALAVHIMTNTALTGAAYDIDGGQQFVF